MKTLPIGQPRFIDPSLLDIGDDISVEYPKDRGIATTLRGIIGKRVESGRSVYYTTNEGATLLAWEPGRANKIRVVLFGRAAEPQETLDLWDEINKRTA